MKKLLLSACAMLAMAFGAGADNYYLIGDFNDWTLPGDAFDDKGSSYVLNVPELTGTFKVIDDAGWSGINLGCGDVRTIVEGEWYQLYSGGDNVQLPTDIEAVKNAVVEFDATNQQLKITGDFIKKSGAQKYYLVGSFQGWDANNGIEMTENSGKYTFSFEILAGGFKIVGQKGWNPINIGTDGGGTLEWDTPLALISNSNSSDITPLNDEMDDVTLVFDPTAMTITATHTVGIESIEVENSANAIYYNLQGVRVNNPENGMFIRVIGTKAVKVAL